MSVLSKLFSRSKLNESWRRSKWGGVRIWSEHVTDKKAPRKYAKSIFKKSNQVDIPLFIRLSEVRPVGEDLDTGQTKIWDCNLEVFWPVGTGRDEEVMSLIEDAFYTVDYFGRSSMDNPNTRANYDELVSEKEGIETWQCNFHISYIGDPQCVDTLLKALNNQETEWTAVKRLGWTRDARAVDPLIDLLQSDKYDLPDFQVKLFQQDIAQSLIRLGDTRGTELALKVLEDYFHSEIGFQKSEIADILVQVGSPAMRIFIDALNSKDKQTLYLSISSLRDIGDEKAVEQLVAFFYRKVPYDTLEYAAEALERIHAPQAVEPLVQLLCDHSTKERVKTIVAGVLGNIGDNRAVETLLSVINSKDTKPKFKKLLEKTIKKIETTKTEDV